MNYLQHKIQHQKDLDGMIILATQKANISGFDMAIVEVIHGLYGKYYEILKYKAAKERNMEVIRHIEPLSVRKLSTDRKLRKPKTFDNPGKPSGD